MSKLDPDKVEEQLAIIRQDGIDGKLSQQAVVYQTLQYIALVGTDILRRLDRLESRFPQP